MGHVFFCEQTDDFLTKAIFEGSAFGFDYTTDAIAASGDVWLRAAVRNFPLYLWSRVIKSTQEKVFYSVIQNPELTSPVWTPLPVPNLNPYADSSPGSKPLLMDILTSGGVAGGTVLYSDIAGGAPLVARRIYSPSESDFFYLRIENAGTANATTTLELVTIRLPPVG